MDPLVKVIAYTHNRDFARLREVVMEELTLRAADLLEHMRPVVAETMITSQSYAPIVKLQSHGLPPGTKIEEKLPKARAGKRRADNC